MTANRLLSFLFLAVIAGMVWWLEDIVQTSQKEALRKENNRPDFYMEDFTIRQYNIDGDLRYVASGSSLLRYPKDENLEIKQLDMKLYKKDKPPMAVKANAASLTNSGDQVLLTGDVDIEQDKTKEQDFLSIRSEKLFIDTTRDYMETNTPIRIQTSKHQVNGTGMQAWTEHRKFRLLTKVRGIHEP